MTTELFDRQLQIISMNLPSCLRATDDEYEQYDLFLQRGAELIKGHRRTLFFLGVDARTTLSRPCPRVASSLLSDLSPSPQLVQMAETLMQNIAAEGTTMINTFSKWWNLLDVKPPTKDTWRGKIFGHMVHRPIDYIATDLETSSRMTAAYDIGYPSDHRALGASYDLMLRPTAGRRRPTSKSIGWRPLDADGYDAEVTARFAHRGAISISALTSDLCGNRAHMDGAQDIQAAPP